MKVLEVGTLNVKAGGPPFSMSRQMYGLKSNGIDCVCLMPPCDENDIIDRNLDYQFTQSVDFHFMGFEHIPDIRTAFESVNDVDMIHIHSIWTYFTHYAAKYARKKHIPYVIAPRGSLYHRAIYDKKWLKKQIAWHCYQKNDINRADCIQATCLEEMEEIRALGCKSPIAIIPNSYDSNRIKCGTYIDSGTFQIGYLGRLAPRKRVEKLIYALSFLKNKHENIKLWVIGSEDEQYEQFLRKEAARFKVDDSVNFTGFLKGETLDKTIRECNIFCFPSDFENWGNVVPDVLVREIPAVTSKGMPWRILENEECGWWIDTDQETINKTLLHAYDLGYDKLRKMGQRGRKLVEEHFSVEPIGTKLKELYTWIVYGGSKPDFVYP